MNEIVPVLKSFLSAGHTFYETWCRYRAERTQRRVERVLAYLATVVPNLEERVRRLEQQPADADLFAATVDSLVQADEDAKADFYAAFLGHLLTESTDRAVLRRVAECFKALTSMELGYYAELREDGRLPQISEDWVEVSLPSRLQSLGLFWDPTRGVYNTRLTSVGLLARSIAIEGKKASAQAR